MRDLLVVPNLNTSNFNSDDTDDNAEEVDEETENVGIIDTFVHLDNLQLSEDELDI